MKSSTVLWFLGLFAVLFGVWLGAGWLLRPQQTRPVAAAATPQIEVPSPAPDPNEVLPHATAQEPRIASVEEMSQPWSSKKFFIRNRLTGADVPAEIVRLPGASALQQGSYWAFSLNAPFGDCQLEYITDLAKLRSDYDFRAAKHPMVVNPCTRTLFDPLKLSNLPGNVWVRGAIVQGSDLRPPLGVEIKMEGRQLLALRME